MQDRLVSELEAITQTGAKLCHKMGFVCNIVKVLGRLEKKKK